MAKNLIRDRKLVIRYAKENQCCERCLKHGRHRRANDVHHIIGGTGCRSDEWWNLLSLCMECHTGFHDRGTVSRDELIDIKESKGEWNQTRADDVRLARI